MKYFSLFLCFLLCCTNKKKSSEEDLSPCCLPIVSDKAITSYISAGELKVTISPQSQNLLLTIRPKGFYPSWLSAGYGKEMVDTFHVYSLKYHDVGYKGTYTQSDILIDTIENISVVTLFDIMNTYKKNDTINQLYSVSYTSMANFIATGFKDKTKNKYLDSLPLFNSKIHTLVQGRDIYISRLTNIPKQTKQQYEVIMRLRSGKVLRDTTDIIE